MARLPKKVKVAAYDIAIKPLSSDVATATNRWGEFEGSKKTIRIEPMPGIGSSIQQLDTMLHEIGHAIYLYYGISDEDREERIVTMMATGYTQVFRDNPKLVEFINEALNE